jgi:hypothetical protein
MITATRQPVNSFFTSHANGDTVKAGAIKLTGVAYSGETGIKNVEVSTDTGKTWKSARINYPSGGSITELLWSWALWEFDWTATSGKQTLMVRAVDFLGRAQPTDQRDIPWNPLGYNYNVVQKIDVAVE